MSPTFRIAPGQLDDAELRILADRAAEKVHEAIMKSGGIIEASFERGIEEIVNDLGGTMGFRALDAYTIKVQTRGGAAYLRADGSREPLLGGEE